VTDVPVSTPWQQICSRNLLDVQGPRSRGALMLGLYPFWKHNVQNARSWIDFSAQALASSAWCGT
jgi:hypothetical protein